MKCKRSVLLLFPVLLLLEPGDALNNQVPLQQVSGPSRALEWVSNEVNSATTLWQPFRAPDGSNKHCCVGWPTGGIRQPQGGMVDGVSLDGRDLREAGRWPEVG